MLLFNRWLHIIRQYIRVAIRTAYGYYRLLQTIVVYLVTLYRSLLVAAIYILRYYILRTVRRIQDSIVRFLTYFSAERTSPSLLTCLRNLALSVLLGRYRTLSLILKPTLR